MFVDHHDDLMLRLFLYDESFVQKHPRERMAAGLPARHLGGRRPTLNLQVGEPRRPAYAYKNL